MNHDTTSINLPPPQRPQSRRPGVPRGVWAALILVSLLVGVAAGWYFGAGHHQGPSVRAADRAHQQDQAIAGKLAEARFAVGAGDWFRARRLFEEVREMDPQNADALASLPLIDQRLDEVRGTLIVKTSPEGAKVQLDAIEEKTSPATFTEVPFGEHDLLISKEEFDPVALKVVVDSEEPKTLPEIALAKSSGQLEVVSEPKGADFKLIRTRDMEVEELVEVGTTPARIERLDPGEYQVLMAVEGWPEKSQRIRVENNRNTSVSAIFAKGGLNITSDPSGAEVWIQTGETNPRRAGTTPLSLSDLSTGKHRLELRHGDWEPIRRTVDIGGGTTRDLEFSWERALVSFRSDPPGAEVYLENQRLGKGAEKAPFHMELPKGEYRFSARYPKLGEVVEVGFVDPERGSNAVDFRFDYGSVKLDSSPSGAAVVSGGMPLGRTPLTLPVIPPGNYTFELSKEQHRPTFVSGTVEPGGTLNFNASLTFDPAPLTSRNFINGLGQEMVWIDPLHGWAGAHEVTQEAYERLVGSNPSYFKASDHPVDSVTWYQAVKFCEALTAYEKTLGTLPKGYRYRLPSDEEWSKLVGNQKLDAAISSLFDRKASTAPVGSLAPNELGLYDVRGNVWEWVGDWYSQTIVNRILEGGATATPEWVGTDRKVLRGGAWNRSSQYDLAVENRMAARPSAEDRYDVGFRVVLMRD